MSDLRRLHKRAMDLAEMATVEKLRGDPGYAAELFREALRHEREAADLIQHDLSAEPTRSILYRSAASLALDCGHRREAEQLIAVALSGNPPRGVAEELRNLFERVNFERHFDLTSTLDTNEVQLSLAGRAVGYGIAPNYELADRLQSFERLLTRTAERKAGLEYREAGTSRKYIREQSRMYVSTPRAASFAITLKVGSTRSQMPLGLTLLDEVLSCLELLDNGHEPQLKERIRNAPYYKNFVELARNLAPDGKDISSVGFTANDRGEERRVVLTRKREQISTREREKRDEPVIVTGTLGYADRRPGRSGRIKLYERTTGKVHDIIVPANMMNEIVKPLWNEEVTVRGIRTSTGFVLQDIHPEG